MDPVFRDLGGGDGRSGTLFRGREASLLIPLVFVRVGRGVGENIPAWGFPVHQKGAMALGAQLRGLIRFAGKFSAGHVVRPPMGALYLSAVTARLYGPSIGGLCRKKTGYIGCESPSGGRAGGESMDLPSPGSRGKV